MAKRRDRATEMLLDKGKNDDGILLLIPLIILIYLIYKGVGLIDDFRTKSHNSELLEKTIQDINTLTNNKETITLEQCLVYVQFNSRCEINDNFTFIPKGLSIWPWAPCPYSGEANPKIAERCSTQKDRTYCEDKYVSYCKECDEYAECEIDDNSLLIYDKHIPCSTKLKNSLDKTILTYCMELAYQKCHIQHTTCQDPFWNGRIIDDKKDHDGLDYHDAYYWEHMKDSYKKLTGR